MYNIRNKEISMRYLKKFFESFEENVLQDFCETHLAYLLDEGYELYIGVRHYYSVQEVLDDKPSELDSYLYEITLKVQL